MKLRPDCLNFPSAPFIMLFTFFVDTICRASAFGNLNPVMFSQICICIQKTILKGLPGGAPGMILNCREELLLFAAD
jgi:hypothetical protein